MSVCAREYVRAETEQLRYYIAAGAPPLALPLASRHGKYIRDIFGVKRYDFGSNITHLLLDRTETARCEASFQAMYERVAAGRIARWKSGDFRGGE